MAMRDMLQMIIGLRELQMRQQAQDLAERQFGFQRQQDERQGQQFQQSYALQKEQEQRLAKAQRQAALQNFQDMRSKMVGYDPRFTPEIAGMTGDSPELLNYIAEQTPTAQQTTQSSVMANNRPVFEQHLVTGAKSDTAKALAFLSLSPEERVTGTRYSLGLELTPAQLAANALGWKNYDLGARQLTETIKEHSPTYLNYVSDLQGDLASAKRDPEGTRLKLLAGLKAEYDKQATMRSTMTEEAQVMGNQILNAYVSRLQTLFPDDPEIKKLPMFGANSSVQAPGMAQSLYNLFQRFSSNLMGGQR